MYLGVEVDTADPALPVVGGRKHVRPADVVHDGGIIGHAVVRPEVDLRDLGGVAADGDGREFTLGTLVEASTNFLL
ncbi:hypothetical protein [Pseudomonas phage vB_PaS-HSN4]|nr:hypothetical protein [Pseudomonas phage vB_PaS-HSN4]